MIINVIQLGRVPYGLGLKVQGELVAARKAGQISDTLVLLEHEPVITLGRNARAEHIIAGRRQLEERGVEVFECDRGGDVTFHGPGQLVGYPIFDLFGYSPRIGAVDFMRKIEEVLIRACAAFEIGAGRVTGLTGVWVNEDPERSEGTISQPGNKGDGIDPSLRSRYKTKRKIAAIGVHISRGVTSHGFALNVNTDLDYFKLIVPCGIADKPVTSMKAELGAEQDLTQVAEAVARSFGQVFGAQILWVGNLDELMGRKVGVPRQAGELEKLGQARNA